MGEKVYNHIIQLDTLKSELCQSKKIKSAKNPAESAKINTNCYKLCTNIL